MIKYGCYLTAHNHGTGAREAEGDAIGLVLRLQDGAAMQRLVHSPQLSEKGDDGVTLKPEGVICREALGKNNETATDRRMVIRWERIAERQLMIQVIGLQ